MAAAKAKYDELVEEGTWMSQSIADKQLVALTAQLEQVKVANTDLQRKLKQIKAQPKQTPKVVNGRDEV